MTGNSSGVVDFPNGLTNNGTAMGAPVKQWKVPQGGYYWYGSQQDTYRVSSLPPFGVKNSIIQTIGTSTAYDKPIAFQFPSPKSGNLNLIEVYNQTAVSGLNLFIGIYSDYNGYPATLLGKVTIDMSSAGNRTSSTFTDASGSSATVTLVEDTPYHVVWVRDDSATQYQIYSANTQNAATSGISMGQSEGYIGMILAQVGGTDNVLPASYNSGSPTFNQFTVHNASIKPINVGIRFA